jgi:hypothetical protein
LNATIGGMKSIALDVANNVLYIADDTYRKIRLLNLVTNIVTTFAGNGTNMNGGDGGPAASAAFKSVYSIALDSTNRKLYVADNNAYVVRVIDLTTNIITTIAGTGVSGNSGDGGDAKLAMFRTVSGLAVDPTTNSLYITDSTNSRVRKVALNTRQISAFVGTGTLTNTGDGGLATDATIKNPTSVAVDTANNLVYIAASGVIRVVNRSNGQINLAAGTTTSGYNGDGIATNTKLSTVFGNIVIDAVNNQVIFGDSSNARVRVIASGNVTTIVGVSYYGDGGPALYAQLNTPTGMALGTNNMLYVSDNNNNVIRAINRTTNIITTIAGKI